MTLDEFMATGRREPISDEAFAMEIGVSRATVSRLRRGKMAPSFDLAARIYEATGRKVSPNDFLASRADGQQPQRRAS